MSLGMNSHPCRIASGEVHSGRGLDQGRIHRQLTLPVVHCFLSRDTRGPYASDVNAIGGDNGGSAVDECHGARGCARDRCDSQVT